MENEMKIKVLREIQEFIFDKMIESVGSSGMTPEGKVWNEIGVDISMQIRDLNAGK